MIVVPCSTAERRSSEPPTSSTMSAVYRLFRLFDFNTNAIVTLILELKLI